MVEGDSSSHFPPLSHPSHLLLPTTPFLSLCCFLRTTTTATRSRSFRSFSHRKPPRRRCPNGPLQLLVRKVPFFPLKIRFLIFGIRWFWVLCSVVYWRGTVSGPKVGNLCWELRTLTWRGPQGSLRRPCSKIFLGLDLIGMKVSEWVIVNSAMIYGYLYVIETFKENETYTWKWTFRRDKIIELLNEIIVSLSLFLISWVCC